MYALAVNGSPRKGGNTEVLLEQVLKPLAAAGWETEVAHIGGKKIQGCRACFHCAEKQDKRCVFEDDFTPVWDKLLRADAIILGSPCYFTDVTAEMKALIDRAGFIAATNGRLLRSKIGAGVIAARRGGATHAYDSINHLFLMSQMLVPGSNYWNMGYGLDKKDVLGDSEALENMAQLGKAIAWLGKAIAPHLGEYPE